MVFNLQGWLGRATQNCFLEVQRLLASFSFGASAGFGDNDRSHGFLLGAGLSKAGIDSVVQEVRFHSSTSSVLMGCLHLYENPIVAE